MIAIIRKLLSTIPVLLGVSTITFFLLDFVPGDPVDIMLGEQASSLDKAALRHELGLDLPASRRFANYIQGLTTFDFGRSLQSKRPVREAIAERLPATAELAFTAMAFALFVGVSLGVLAAVRHRTWLDQAISFWGLVAMSTPGFWLGPMLVLLISVQLDLLPVSERGGFDHLFLPAVTLAWSLSSVLMQITRASMLETTHEDYIRVARAKGVAPFSLFFKHALANAIMPVITVAGLQFGAVLTGTVVIETIFDWPGIGTLLFQAIQQRDYPMVQGCVLVIALIYVFVSLATDIAYQIANPRLRAST